MLMIPFRTDSQVCLMSCKVTSTLIEANRNKNRKLCFTLPFEPAHFKPLKLNTTF